MKKTLFLSLAAFFLLACSNNTADNSPIQKNQTLQQKQGFKNLPKSINYEEMKELEDSFQLIDERFKKLWSLNMAELQQLESDLDAQILQFEKYVQAIAPVNTETIEKDFSNLSQKQLNEKYKNIDAESDLILKNATPFSEFTILQRNYFGAIFKNYANALRYANKEVKKVTSLIKTQGLSPVELQEMNGPKSLSLERYKQLMKVYEILFTSAEKLDNYKIIELQSFNVTLEKEIKRLEKYIEAIAPTQTSFLEAIWELKIIQQKTDKEIKRIEKKFNPKEFQKNANAVDILLEKNTPFSEYPTKERNVLGAFFKVYLKYFKELSQSVKRAIPKNYKAPTVPKTKEAYIPFNLNNPPTAMNRKEYLELSRRGMVLFHRAELKQGLNIAELKQLEKDLSQEIFVWEIYMIALEYDQKEMERMFKDFFNLTETQRSAKYKKQDDILFKLLDKNTPFSKYSLAQRNYLATNLGMGLWLLQNSAKELKHHIFLSTQK